MQYPRGFNFVEYPSSLSTLGPELNRMQNLLINPQVLDSPNLIEFVEKCQQASKANREKDVIQALRDLSQKSGGQEFIESIQIANIRQEQQSQEDQTILAKATKGSTIRLIETFLQKSDKKDDIEAGKAVKLRAGRFSKLKPGHKDIQLRVDDENNVLIYQGKKILFYGERKATGLSSERSKDPVKDVENMELISKALEATLEQELKDQTRQFAKLKSRKSSNELGG